MAIRRMKPQEAAPPPPPPSTDDFSEVDIDDPELLAPAPATPETSAGHAVPAPVQLSRAPAQPGRFKIPQRKPEPTPPAALAHHEPGDLTPEQIRSAGPVGDGWQREPIDFVQPVGWFATMAGSAIQGVVLGVERFTKPRNFRAIMVVLTRDVDLIIKGGEWVEGRRGDLAGITVTSGLESLADRIEHQQENGGTAKELWLMSTEKVAIDGGKTFWKFKGNSRPAAANDAALLNRYHGASLAEDGDGVPF